MKSRHLFQFTACLSVPAKMRTRYDGRMERRREPWLATSPELEGVLKELIAREPIFHRAEFGTTRADFERMTAEEFWETGASGQRYSREFVLDELERRHTGPHQEVWEASEFGCRELGPNLYLLTYTLAQNGALVQDSARKTRRATVWRRTPEGWKIVYHQGTKME
jgi:hypothetical protein